MKKRLLLLIFAVSLAFCICACGKSGDSGKSTNSNSTVDTQETSENGIVGNNEGLQENAVELTSFEELFRDGPIPAQDTNELWGYIDQSGSWAIPPEFASAKEFWDSGLAPAQDSASQLWGLIDNSGQYVVEPSFEMIASWPSEGLFRVRVPERGWGYINTSGEFVIEPQFDGAYDFSNGFARVSTRRGFTGADNQTPYLLWGYINTSGERITEDIFCEAYDFSEGLACVKQGDIFSGFYGYIDESGKFAVDPLYTEATAFSDGVAFVSMWAAGNTYYGLIGKDGYGITGPICGHLPSPNGYKASFTYGLCPVQPIGQEGEVYINTSGEIILPKDGIPYQHADSFSGGYAVVCMDNLFGYIDLEGNWVIPPQFSTAGNFYHDMAFIREPGSLEELINGTNRNGIIDTSGNYILEFGADVELIRWYPTDRIIVKERSTEKVGFWNLTGDIVIDYIFDEVQAFSEDYSYAKVKYNGLWGIIDKDGNWLIPVQFMSLG